MEHHSVFHYDNDITAQQELFEVVRESNEQRIRAADIMQRLALCQQAVILDDDRCEITPCRTNVSTGNSYVAGGVGLYLRIPDPHSERGYNVTQCINVGMSSKNALAFHPFDVQDVVLLEEMLVGLDQARDAQVLPNLSADSAAIEYLFAD